jgi:hypothetical protein
MVAPSPQWDEGIKTPQSTSFKMVVSASSSFPKESNEPQSLHSYNAVVNM